MAYLMPQVNYHTTINAPLFDVFKMATDFAGMPTWARGTRSTHLMNADPLRTGSMISIERMFGGTLVFINADLIEFQRNKGYEMAGAHGRFRFRRSVEFSAGGGQTQVRDTFTIHTSFLYFWYNPILKMNLQGYVKSEWEQVAKALGKA